MGWLGRPSKRASVFLDVAAVNHVEVAPDGEKASDTSENGRRQPHGIARPAIPE
jgi:hypothetical protein